VKILNHKAIYWECTIDGHSKFWAGQIFERKIPINKLEYVLERKWGMIGTEGQRMEQTYTDRYEAEKALEVLIRDKENKGYIPIF